MPFCNCNAPDCNLDGDDKCFMGCCGAAVIGVAVTAGTTKSFFSGLWCVLPVMACAGMECCDWHWFGQNQIVAQQIPAPPPAQPMAARDDGNTTARSGGEAATARSLGDPAFLCPPNAVPSPAASPQRPGQATFDFPGPEGDIGGLVAAAVEIKGNLEQNTNALARRP